MENLRKYGNSPYNVVVVHGGPGAPGEMKPVALELSSSYRVLEPLQTANTIKGQVEELKSVIENQGTPPVILVGWSWGAWLSFITTAENPSLIKKLILISSGPFETKYAESIMPTRLSHLKPAESERVKVLINILQKGNANNDILQEFGELMSKADSYNPIPRRGETIEVQADVYENIWKEAEEIRRNGKLLEYGKLINCPVVVIHGDYDSHPYEGVKKPLSRVLKDCEFILLKNCGHHPWLEKQAKDDFYSVLEKELRESL